MINIVGLGPGNIEDLTVGTYKILKESKMVLFKTKNHPLFKILKEEIEIIKSYDKFYKDVVNIDYINKKIAEDVIKIYRTIGDVVYAVPTNPFNKEKSVETIIKICDENKISYKVYPAVSGLGSESENQKIDSKVYIPKGKGEKIYFEDLINLVETLRGENGCPWDMEQTHESIKNELLEETYEFIEAIENNDLQGMREELGDVLFHVVFHCSISEKEGYFNINDIIEGVINKMVYRHPHVFGRDSVINSEEVLEKWDDIKKVEKNYNTITDEMRAVAKTLPSLIKAHKIQKKAAKVGFDWDNIEDTAEKVKEELLEVLDVYKSNNKEKIKDEVGDLLFACVNVARKLDINGEEAVNSTIKKFMDRFSFIENSLIEEGKKFNEVSLEYMDRLWTKAKSRK